MPQSKSDIVFVSASDTTLIWNCENQLDAVGYTTKIHAIGNDGERKVEEPGWFWEWPDFVDVIRILVDSRWKGLI
jgi:hypothetical protein